MKHFFSALASYARVVITTSIVVIINLGHAPSGAAEWKQVGVGAAWALLPVVLRWLNPGDTAYGVGAR